MLTNSSLLEHLPQQRHQKLSFNTYYYGLAYHSDHRFEKTCELILQQIRRRDNPIGHYSSDSVFSSTILDIYSDTSDIRVPAETTDYP